MPAKLNQVKAKKRCREFFEKDLDELRTHGHQMFDAARKSYSLRMDIVDTQVQIFARPMNTPPSSNDATLFSGVGTTDSIMEDAETLNLVRVLPLVSYLHERVDRKLQRAEQRATKFKHGRSRPTNSDSVHENGSES